MKLTWKMEMSPSFHAECPCLPPPPAMFVLSVSCFVAELITTCIITIMMHMWHTYTHNTYTDGNTHGSVLLTVNKLCPPARGLFSHECSESFISPGFEIPACETPASTPMEVKGISFVGLKALKNYIWNPQQQHLFVETMSLSLWIIHTD